MKTMGADFCFRMGASHQVCQDYADAGEVDGLVCAAVSDGCSSSPHTDFGARFLVRSFWENVEPVPKEDRLIRGASRMAAVCGLPQSCLDATLLAAVATENCVEVLRAGDGVMVVRHLDGSVFFEQVAYDNNAPRYLSYMLNDRKAYDYLCLVEGFTARRGQRAPGGSWVYTEYRHSVCATPDVDRWSIARSEVDLVLLLSDGVESFQDAQGVPVPLETILDELLAFKGFAGQFIARRCNKFLGKVCQEKGWKHTDDFAAAGIYLGRRPP